MSASSSVSAASSSRTAMASEPVAIVGMGARFAGAVDLPDYWQMCLEGRAEFRQVPEHRWAFDAFYAKSARATDKTTAKTGAFIEDIRTFPAVALGLPPRRVEVMDPQQRLGIECAIEALEDAGMLGRAPERTGVYMGVTAQEWRNILNSRIIAALMATGQFGHQPDDPASILDAVSHVVPSRPFTAIGVLGNMMAASIAQELDLMGPAYTTDAACASAAMAIVDAVHQLRAGAIDAAVAGGVYLCITPDHHVAFARIGAMSVDGVCRPFDHRADGFVQGDGCGLVVLKRLSDAERDGDRIYAVIHGVAANNDGKGDGPMAPVHDGQARAITAAWQDAGLDPSGLGYVETHGTGTAVGDVTEVNGLHAAFGGRVKRAALGSSKANVGHTMSAAAAAGIIRTALAIHHKTLPPMAHFEAPKADLDLDEKGLWVPTEPTAWDDPDRLACVSSFGFGGTNGHIVLKAPPPRAARSLHAGALPAPAERPELVCLSAADEAQLRVLAGRTADAIDADPAATVAAVARTCAGRMAGPSRLALVASTRDELIEQLRNVASSSRDKRIVMDDVLDEAPKIAFMYPGQGSQRPGMLGQLRARFPVVAAALADMEAALDGELPDRLTTLLYPEQQGGPVDADAAMDALTATEVCQPVLLSCGVALTALLDQVGIRPHVVVGHSLGEFTAAAVAGVLSPADGARFVARRGRAMAGLPGDHGAMAAVMAPREDVEPLLVDGAVIANVNHPRQLVISGTRDAVAQVVERATAAEITAKPLQVSHAFHSPVLDGLDASPLLDGITLSDPQVPVASGIAAAPYADAADARAVFLRHATSPVEYVRALEQCAEVGADLYLQVGAGGPLASFARGAAPKPHHGVLNLSGMDDDDGGAALLQTLGRLWCKGAPVDLLALTVAVPPATLPAKQLAREDYWPVKDVPQLPVKLAGVKTRTAPAPAAAPAPAEAAPVEAAASADSLDDRVIAVIAKVSAYPIKALKPGMGLQSDLGFDSLMVNDLAGGLKDAFGIQGIPQELLLNKPTVQDIIDFVAGGGGVAAAEEHDDDAPLAAWRPVWRHTALTDLPRQPRLSGERVLVVGEGAVDEVLATLHGPDVTRAGAEEAASAGPADLLLWQAPALGDATGAADATAALIAALGRQAAIGRTPDVLILRGEEAWAESLSGVARSLAMEWPDRRVKVVTLAGAPARLAARELSAADRTVDVRLSADGREVMGLAPHDGVPAALPADAVAVVTGGTRGIGAAVAAALAERGHRLLLVGRSAPQGVAADLVAAGKAVHVAADVTDRSAFLDAGRAVLPADAPVIVVHAAGILADGPLGSVDPARGRAALAVKVDGWQHALELAGENLAAATAIGSWAGRFGNRHQAWYAAANALLASLCAGCTAPASVCEFGPWSRSEMVATIPAVVQAAMRAEGVDFVGDQAGLDAVLAGLGTRGPRTLGRALPHTTRAVSFTETLSVETHPFLLDHAIQGVPVLPLASATDLLAAGAGLPLPFELTDLTLFQGVTVREPVDVHVSVRGDKAELRVGAQKALAYTARIRPLTTPPALPDAVTGGAPADPPLSTFYGGITFHGPLLQGITEIGGVGPTFVHGRVRTGNLATWVPDTLRGGFTVDPLALDSAMQLSAHVAWTRFQRAGTPIGIERYVQLAPWPAPGTELLAQVSFAEDLAGDSDRFEGHILLSTLDGTPVAWARGVAAELRRIDQQDGFDAEPRQIDFSAWKEIRDLDDRLTAAQAIGIDNPFFHVHEGTARNTAIIEGREYVNYSSYNYIGLSGDPRVLARVRDAVDRYGTSVSASRVASGERPFHGALEALLAKCQGTEDAILYTAGHATNVSTIGHLMGKDDLILHDELIHDSALQGVKLSGATRRGFKHDDAADLERQLRALRSQFDRVLIILEGVYSMDGDICDLPSFVAIKKKYGCLLMVDEAHSFGIVGETGCGVREHYGIPGTDVDIWMGTLSKSLASCGGWIAGRKELIRYLKYTSPGFVYSAGLTAANGVAALASLELMLAEPERVKRLQDNARLFHDALVARGLDTGPADGESGVVPVVTGNSVHALWLSQRLHDAGINVQPIVYPAVADDAARLRFFLSSTHTPEQLSWTAQTVADCLARVRAEFPL
ncbi:MAG: aminotransferase class I/II-fold pyridoxal phosphate-dependent enzyme [Alphaproteobacteria bacterium]|nr:aminotransferase class I/II-fold pyridoxal phosphate-dependent enzyme [Alphaproteobacteria bacterium]